MTMALPNNDYCHNNNTNEEIVPLLEVLIQLCGMYRQALAEFGIICVVTVAVMGGG